MRRLSVLACLALASCVTGGGGSVVPPPTPVVTTPSPVCAAGQTYGCYHNPGTGWVYACPSYDLRTGGVIGVINVPTEAACVKPVVVGGGCTLSGQPTAPTSSPNSFGAQVNAAMHTLRPDCEIGGTCLLGDTTQQEWQAAVEAKLREAGLCAGQHAPYTDEIAVAAKAGDAWLGYHVFAGNDGPGPVPLGGVRRTVKWSPEAYTGAWLPPGAPAPGPSPSTPPATCSDPLPLRAFPDGSAAWQIKSHPHVPQYVIDCTPMTYKQLSFCEAIGQSPMADGTPRDACPFGWDLTDARSCKENWISGGYHLEAQNGARCEMTDLDGDGKPDNPLWFNANNGNCRLCSNSIPKVCSSWW